MSTETTGPRSAATQDEAQPVYVYGVIPAADAASWPQTGGLDGPSSIVRTVVEGGLAALVSDLPPDRTPGRPEDLETYRRVLSQAIERGTTIPMRFGIVMDSEEVVRQLLLTRHAAKLCDLMEALDGHVQMMVKAFYAEDALLRDVVADQPELARESAALVQRPEAETHAARVRLGEMVARAVDVRREEVESALLEQLSPLVADIQVEPASSERVALSAQVLVHRDRRAALDEKVRELSEALAGVLALRYVGPLPPYSFADLSLEEDEEQWD
jgi:Gas vesicle synthesis protein GvpL/GvpF